jgi:ATP-dependent phosphoenolpyruvate carboxykinase
MLPLYFVVNHAYLLDCSFCVAENTRASYPIDYIDNAKIPCVGPHPRNVVLLCCDAFGVLPPVSKLSLEQVMYHFISGYTSKVGKCYNNCYDMLVFGMC